MATATENEVSFLNLPISDIRTDGDTQCRLGVDLPTVAEYSQLLVGNFEFPPLIVYFDGEFHWLADGFHRILAYEMAHIEDVPCEIREGTQEDAAWHALSANRAHGLRLSNADKANAVKLALKHPKGSALSNSLIAEHVGVHADTVDRYRKELEDAGEIQKAETREGRDGKRRKAPASKKSTKPAAEPAEMPPERQVEPEINLRNSEVEQSEPEPELRPHQQEAVEEVESELEESEPVELNAPADHGKTKGNPKALCKAIEDRLGAVLRAVDDLSRASGGDDKFIRKMRECINGCNTAVSDYRRANR